MSYYFFFFKQKTSYEMRISDWSSDVCSSDLNMKFRLEEMVQREFFYAIVDEVDSILIDEARTPLIISGPTEDSSELYLKADALIPKLGPEDFEKDEKQRTVALTEQGAQRMEELLTEAGLLTEGSLYDIDRKSTRLNSSH